MSTPDSGAAAMAGPGGDYPRTWVVDAANVIGARPDGWWRDRAGAAGRLLAGISARLASPGAQTGAPAGLPWPERVVVVLEGAARGAAPEGPVSAAGTAENPSSAGPDGPVVEVVHAPAHGDDAIVVAARSAAQPVLAVTSDRGLADRLRPLGITVRGSGWLRDLLDGGTPPDIRRPRPAGDRPPGR